MRHFALLLGILFTSGSTFVLHLAVGSSGFERLSGATENATELAAPDRAEVWYGGELPPITIDAGRRPSPGAIAWVRLLEGSKREACSTVANQLKAPSAMRAGRRTAHSVAL
ncbi:MAG TPA: hypothetical protein VLV16_14785 [Gemmatimonadales bacterium]|nr:hypothetical protein [Gemmatimonadales bacterium]